MPPCKLLDDLLLLRHPDAGLDGDGLGGKQGTQATGQRRKKKGTGNGDVAESDPAAQQGRAHGARSMQDVQLGGWTSLAPSLLAGWLPMESISGCCKRTLALLHCTARGR